MQTIDAISIGNIAVNLQTGVANVAHIATRLGLEPVLVLDYVKHFSDSQVEKIRAELQRKKS